VELPEIESALDESAALAAVEDAFRRMSAGQAQVAAVGHLAFGDPPGDCHVKGGYLNGDDVFVFKIATSFYRNPNIGLPSSNGMMIIVSARTGENLALLNDRGYLTDLRTAMAGAIAARAIARSDAATLGIVGTGIQARMQAEQVSRALGIRTVVVWGRNPERRDALASDIGGEAVDLPELCALADIIVTATPSDRPLLSAEMVRPGTRIVAVGADSPGKQELETALVAKARIIVDSRPQCVAHGEAGWAVRAGLVREDSLMELGALLASPVWFGEDEIVIADLTGVAVQDVAIAKCVWTSLSGQ
jgi:ornithine cyclodeaminase